MDSGSGNGYLILCDLFLQVFIFLKFTIKHSRENTYSSNTSSLVIAQESQRGTRST